MKKTAAIIGIVSVLSFAGAAFAGAHGSDPAVRQKLEINPSGHVSLVGTLKSVATSSLVVTTWGGDWTVNTGSAKMIRRSGGSSALSEMRAGDEIRLNGKINASSSFTIDATVLRNQSIQAKNAEFSGTVSNLNSASSSFTLSTRKRGDVKVVVNSDARILVNGTSSQISALANGMFAEVRGIWDRSQSDVQASRVIARTANSTSTHKED